MLPPQYGLADSPACCPASFTVFSSFGPSHIFRPRRGQAGTMENLSRVGHVLRPSPVLSWMSWGSTTLWILGARGSLATSMAAGAGGGHGLGLHFLMHWFKSHSQSHMPMLQGACGALLAPQNRRLHGSRTWLSTNVQAKSFSISAPYTRPEPSVGSTR